VKDGAQQAEEDTEIAFGDARGRTSTSSWRIKKPRSMSMTKRTKPPSSYTEPPPVPVIPSSIPSSKQANAPCLPPLVLSPYSKSDASLPSSPITRMNGSGRQVRRAPSTTDVLLPPQPAFLGGRSTSAPHMSRASNGSSSLMNGSNSSCVSLMSANSSLTTDATSLPRSGASNVSSLKTQQGKTKKDTPTSGSRFTMQSLGRRFFSRSEKTADSDSKELHPAPPQPTVTRSRGGIASAQDTNQYSSSVQPMPTPPLSYQSRTASSSSCTSTSSSIPATPSGSHSPTLMPKTSSNSASTVQVRSTRDASSPAPTSPTYNFISGTRDTEESTDFLRAVLSYALADTGSPVESEEIAKQHTSTPNAGSKPIEQAMKREAMPLRSAWGNETDDESEDSDDDYGNEGDTVDNRKQRFEAARAKATKLRSLSTTARRSVGLDTAAKRALYACTIIKIYPKLSATTSSEIKVPRSVNTAMSLLEHHSSYSHKRSISIGLARSRVIRRLNTEPLSLKMEQELSWFVLKYLVQFIAPNELSLHLAQKAVESGLEALARPPLVQGSGMAQWANRKPFAQRCECITAEVAKIEMPLKELRLQVGQLFSSTSKNAPQPMALQLSQRCQALASTSSPAKSILSGFFQGSKAPSSPSDDIKDAFVSTAKEKQRLAPPWASPASKSTARSSKANSRSPSPLRLEVPASSDKLRAIVVADDEDEDVPLAKLMTRRRSRAVSESGASQVAPDEYAQRYKQQQERELIAKKQRELMLLQEQKRLLEMARERRQKTEHAAVLSSHTYGAGDALLTPRRQSKAISEAGNSPDKRFSRSYSAQSLVGSPAKRTSQYELQKHMQRSTSYSNASTPNLTPSPPSARRERPSRSRVNSQATAPSAWSPSPRTSPPSAASNRPSALPSMPRATSLYSMPAGQQSMTLPNTIPQHAIHPFQQQPISPYALMPMTSPPSYNRQSMVMISPYHLSPMPYHTSPPHPLSYSAPHYRVDVNAAS
jgi:hypothetical protein